MPLIGSGLDLSDFHILLIDDDPMESARLGSALQETRPQISIDVIDPELAIRFLHKEAEFADRRTPDLVLLDYRMPTNGGRVLSILKGDPILRGIPVVVMSRQIPAGLQTGV
jgi:CheY-like chemotaxis protein